MGVQPVDHGHVAGGASERFRGLEPAEARADDDNLGPPVRHAPVLRLPTRPAARGTQYNDNCYPAISSATPATVSATASASRGDTAILRSASRLSPTVTSG